MSNNKIAAGAGVAQRNVLRLIVGQGMILAVIGLLIGLVVAFATARLLTSLLYGISPADPVTFTGVAFLLAAVAAPGCYVPARRATKVDPLVALRCRVRDCELRIWMARLWKLV